MLVILQLQGKLFNMDPKVRVHNLPHTDLECNCLNIQIKRRGIACRNLGWSQLGSPESPDGVGQSVRDRDES
jgi:hypothetical protein